MDTYKEDAPLMPTPMGSELANLTPLELTRWLVDHVPDKSRWVDISDDRALEEARFQSYQDDPDNWLSIKIGQSFVWGRYMVLLKLGFGTVSTVWLCRDTVKHKYVTMKVFKSGSRQELREDHVLHHIEGVLLKSEYEARWGVRYRHDRFWVLGSTGIPRCHTCLIHTPLSYLFDQLLNMRPGEIGRLHAPDVQRCLRVMLDTLDFLHSEAKVIHADIHTGNFMLGTNNYTIFSEFVKEAWAGPLERRVANGRVTHRSAFVSKLPTDGWPVLADFGMARIGLGPIHGVDVMANIYRPP
ncbi:kinase-like domain-containing protein [Podospora aff. communis PSN243]|uniref:non-specific serine/threonine protein kinase n=1 Tax=Podospora aff. communis PSN243 TaxID=3040156 RepID=A0AAV9G8I5_9PEZI|nr:kinase-like domain-containing protein [Podospora aff. communis PSN243]